MNRRGALVTIGLATLSAVARSVAKPLRLLKTNVTNSDLASFDAQSKDTVDDRLRKDLARLAPRVYSEEGIPVFLACDNLVRDKTSLRPTKVKLRAMNTAFASALHRNAEAYQRIRPDAQAKDVAPLIEVLADRDFTTGGNVEEQ